MKVLITGASGFTGRALIRFLLSLGIVEIAGIARKDNPELIHAPSISWLFADLLDSGALFAAVSSADPDAVVHLAGLTRGTLGELRTANVKGTGNLLDAVLHVNNSCPVVVVSSSAVYGYAGPAPISEVNPLKPVSEYGTSKVEQEALCNRYTMTKDSLIALARPFNLVGPNQPASFVCGRIIQQVIEIEQRTRAVIDLMEVSSSRDFIDVRDVVRGYWALLSHPRFRGVCAGKTFNIGSGEPHSITDVIQILEELTGNQYSVQIPGEPVTVTVPYQRSDNSRMYAATGWKPALTFPESIRDMLEAEQMLVGIR